MTVMSIALPDSSGFFAIILIPAQATRPCAMALKRPPNAIGRAARNSDGRIIMYADTMTDSMKAAIDETDRRRRIQDAYNKENGITPTTIRKAVRDLISIHKEIAKEEAGFAKDPESMDEKELKKLIESVEKGMRRAAAELDFETAA